MRTPYEALDRAPRGDQGNAKPEGNSVMNEAPTVMTDLVERLDALDAKRTPGPWEQDQSAIHTADLMTIRIVDCGGLQHRTGPGQHTIPAYYHQSVDNA